MKKQTSRFYRQLPYSDLVKADYNRPIDRSRVIRIKKNYNPFEVRPVIVSFRDGKYYIIDGQHTATMLFELNNRDPATPIDCDIRYGLTYEQEADLYVRLNKNSKKISIVDEIKGLIESRDENALLFQETIEKSGYTLFDKNNGIRAASTVWGIFNGKDGQKRLEDTLTLINEMWQNKRGATDALTIKSITAFLAIHSTEYDRGMFIKKLSKENPYELILAAKSHSRITRHEQPYSLYLGILSAYNKQLRTNVLVDKYYSFSK